jgi:carbonic anhydrase
VTFGLRQSPIDLGPAVVGDSGELVIEYGETAVESRDTATTREHNVSNGNNITYRDHEYALQQFHLHTPSEHVFDGEFALGEIHFVHTDDEGKSVVVGVLVEEGDPVVPGSSDEGVLDLRDLVPSSLTHYAYGGSKTTPPFTEGVDWIILAERLAVTLDQLGQFRGRFGMNNRPIQPLNGRAIVVG